MFKIANQVLDQFDDTGKVHLRKLAVSNPHVYMLSEEERTALPDDDFALSVITKKAAKLNKFPIDSADSTWLSSQYFNETHFRLPKEAAEVAAYHLRQACEKFNVEATPAVEALAKEASSNLYVERDLPSTSKVHRTVEPDFSKFAEVQKIGDNYTFAQYAFPTVAHVKLGNAYFDKYVDKMPVEYRHKYACALQRRAGELGFELKGRISKFASNNYSAHVGAHIGSRRSLLEVADPKFTAALDKLASMKDTLSPIDFAKVLHGFDKRAGLDKYYDGYLTNPYESTFSKQTNPAFMFKSASYGEVNADSIGKLASEKYGKVKEYFGVSIADALKKDGISIFDSLPMDAKEILAGIADGTL